jgi:hypothetical protein
MKKILNNLEDNKLYLYTDMINPINKLISIAQEFVEDETLEVLTELITKIKRANNLAKDLYKLDNVIREVLIKFFK